MSDFTWQDTATEIAMNAFSDTLELQRHIIESGTDAFIALGKNYQPGVSALPPGVSLNMETEDGYVGISELNEDLIRRLYANDNFKITQMDTRAENRICGEYRRRGLVALFFIL